MKQRSTAPGPSTLAAIAALAFVLACVAHEAVGHGGACLAGGGRITKLTSVYFRCSKGTPFTDASGPSMNLFAGLTCLAMLKLRPGMAIRARVFVLLAMAFNLLWGTGYFVLSAVTVGGDLAFALRDLAPPQLAMARAAMATAGLIGYLGSSRLLATMWPPRASLLVPYVAAGGVLCASVLFFQGPLLPALREAAIEGFGSAVALPLIALRRTRRGRIVDVDAGDGIRDSSGSGWIVLALVVTIVFCATLGRGYGQA